MNKMEKNNFKGIFIFLGMLFLVAFSLSIVSAATCTIEATAADCTNGVVGGKVVMHLSDMTNAHGELANQSNYQNVLSSNAGNELR